APGRYRSDDRRYCGTAHHCVALRFQSIPLGGDDIPPDVNAFGPDFRQLVRHPRTETVFPAWRDAVRRHVGLVRRRGHVDVPADRWHGAADSLSWAAGDWRRHGDGPALHDCRRHFFPERTGTVRWPLLRCLGRGINLRADARRLADGSVVVARML